MPPTTTSGEIEHRRHKRQLEVKLATDAIASFVNRNAAPGRPPLRILEFGSGYGFQIPDLQRLGDLVASDIYVNDGVKQASVKFCACSIAHTPFKERCFDLVFSNHVIEHIVELQTAFDELHRIGSDRCVYAFAVPTNWWLLFSVPSQYYSKVRGLIARLHRSGRVSSRGNATPHGAHSSMARPSWLARLLPAGHGVNATFWRCFKAFRIRQWRRVFEASGFAIADVRPLLLYGASEWPILPTTRRFTRYICSSVLFLLTKADSAALPGRP
jgi:SAM-dependent methyltransferase